MDMGLFPIAADREVEVREYDTNIDYGFTAVANIEDLELKHNRIKMSKRKTEHNLKNTTQDYQKMSKIKEQITSKRTIVINQRQVTQMLKQNRLSILKSLDKCMVRQRKIYKTLVG